MSKNIRRILVASASVGAGHLSAARAIEAALCERIPGAIIKNVDVLETTNSAFRKLYGKLYLDLIHQAPHVLGYIYDLLDRPDGPSSPLLKRLKLATQRANLVQFSELLRNEPWDLMINTHFLPAELAAALKKKGRIAFPQVIVTTDFQTHRLWVNEPCEHYFAATEEGAAYLGNMGISADRITISGIPVHPNFAVHRSKASCRAALGFDENRTTVLQIAGGFGVGPIAEIYSQLLRVQTPLQIVVITGKNAAVRAQLTDVRVPKHHRATIVGFTDRVFEYMGASDLIVSKPGGLTTSEALACNLPMVIVNPVPGQESLNSDFLLENGAAIKIHKLFMLGNKIEQALQPETLKRLQQNSSRLGRPNAAYTVIERALKLIS